MEGGPAGSGSDGPCLATGDSNVDNVDNAGPCFFGEVIALPVEEEGVAAAESDITGIISTPRVVRTFF